MAYSIFSVFQENCFFSLAGATPNITIVNGTNSSVHVRSIEAKYGEAVELICHLSYKVSKVIVVTEFSMRWKKENGNKILREIKVPLKKSFRVEYLEEFLFKYTVVVNSYHDGGTYSCLLDGSINSPGYITNLTESVELKSKLIQYTYYSCN